MSSWAGTGGDLEQTKVLERDSISGASLGERHPIYQNSHFGKLSIMKLNFCITLYPTAPLLDPCSTGRQLCGLWKMLVTSQPTRAQNRKALKPCLELMDTQIVVACSYRRTLAIKTNKVHKLMQPGR